MNRAVQGWVGAVALAMLAGCGGGGRPELAPAPAAGASSVRAECARVGGEGRPGCYEEALLGVLRARGVEAAMTTLDGLAALDTALRAEGHVYAHAIGLAAYTSPETVGATFASCDPSYQSGCYHGVIQAYFADPQGGGGAAGLTPARVNALCADYRGPGADAWLLFQCAHGIGHGLTMVLGHQLPRALRGCDLLEARWEQEACYGGAFMENLVQATAPHHAVGRPHAAGGPAPDEHAEHAEHAGHAGMEMEPSFRALDPADPLYPCSALEARYLGACYNFQTSVVLHLNGGDLPAAARACNGAPERYRPACYQSLGRDVSTYSRQSHAAALRVCSLGDARYQPWCHVGFAKNLVDLTARPADGLAYCRAVPEGEGKRSCYRAVGEQVQLLERGAEGREAMCAPSEADYRETCRAAAGLPAAGGGPTR